MPRQRREIPWLKIRHGTYYVYWYESESKRTKRASTGTANPVEAQKWYAAFLSGGHAVLGPGSTRGVTVKVALDDYRREHVAAHVVDQARAEDAIAHLKAWFKDELLKDVDIPASRAYADARRMGLIGGGKRRKSAEGADSTIRRELVVLRAAAGHALRWKRITASEMPSIEMPRETPREEVWLTQAEFLVARTAAAGALRDFIDVAYYTAARRASVERLTRFQVDLANSRINLSSPNESANQRRSVKRRPVVPIDPEIRPTVERLMTANKDSEWLFGTPRSMYRAFKGHMTKLELGAKSNPHILRHSRATHLLQAGVDIYSVARLLGDTVATVERVYGHHSPDYLADAITKAAL